jgi:hypothetical protein
MTKTDHFVGKFPTQKDAEDYARQQAARIRRFVTLEVWTGTADHPEKQTKVVPIKGVH